MSIPSFSRAVDSFQRLHDRYAVLASCREIEGCDVPARTVSST
jgi:hypothetical protein